MGPRPLCRHLVHLVSSRKGLLAHVPQTDIPFVQFHDDLMWVFWIKIFRMCVTPGVSVSSPVLTPCRHQCRGHHSLLPVAPATACILLTPPPTWPELQGACLPPHSPPGKCQQQHPGRLLVYLTASPTAQGARGGGRHLLSEWACLRCAGGERHRCPTLFLHDVQARLGGELRRQASGGWRNVGRRPFPWQHQSPRASMRGRGSACRSSCCTCLLSGPAGGSGGVPVSGSTPGQGSVGALDRETLKETVLSSTGAAVSLCPVQPAHCRSGSGCGQLAAATLRRAESRLASEAAT